MCPTQPVAGCPGKCVCPEQARVIAGAYVLHIMQRSAMGCKHQPHSLSQHHTHLAWVANNKSNRPSQQSEHQVWQTSQHTHSLNNLNTCRRTQGHNVLLPHSTRCTTAVTSSMTIAQSDAKGHQQPGVSTHNNCWRVSYMLYCKYCCRAPAKKEAA